MVHNVRNYVSVLILLILLQFFALSISWSVFLILSFTLFKNLFFNQLWFFWDFFIYVLIWFWRWRDQNVWRNDFVFLDGCWLWKTFVWIKRWVVKDPVEEDGGERIMIRKWKLNKIKSYHWRGFFLNLFLLIINILTIFEF